MFQLKFEPLKRIILPVIGAVLFITGCTPAVTALATPNSSSPLPTPTAHSVLSRATPTLAPTLVETPTQLTLWTIEEISFMAKDKKVANFLTRTIQTFKSANPDIEVQVLVKKPSGKGSVLDFLRTAKDVAPTVLPDIVVMDATDLNQASVDKLILPLDGKLDRAIVQDLLPAARRVGTVDGKLVGIPLGINLEHAVINTRSFTGTVITWTDILSKNTHYLFPAKGVNGLVNDATLAQYLSAGGSLVSDEGRPKLDERVLNNVLLFYESGLKNGIINPNLLQAATTEELWPNYLAGKAGIAQISVSQYLTDREKLTNSSPIGLPVLQLDSPQVSVMHARVLALVTNNQARQDAALKLIQTILSTDNNAAWNKINNSIPVRDTAYQQLAANDSYWQFLTGLLNTAQPEPRFVGYDRVGRILQQAVEQVINGESTAEKAASTAMDALAQ